MPTALAAAVRTASRRWLTLTNARLVDPEGDRILTGGLVIDDGRIAEVFEGHRPGDDCNGRHLAPGIIDIGVKVGEPGERHKESFRTAGASAAAGGVTTIVTRPDTLPAIDTPETLEFLQRRAVGASPVNVLPMAALTKGREGREMTEIGFLLDAGAVAFTDARAVADARVFQRCLTYAAGLGALVVGHPQEPALSEGACMTAGQFASQLGLPRSRPSPSASASSATSPSSRRPAPATTPTSSPPPPPSPPSAAPAPPASRSPPAPRSTT